MLRGGKGENERCQQCINRVLLCVSYYSNATWDSLALALIAVYLNLKFGWVGFTVSDNQGQLEYNGECGGSG